MKHEKDARLLSIAFALIVIVVALVMLALFTLTGKAQVDDGYPAPIDSGYPVGYPMVEPAFDEYGYPIDVGYPMLEPYFDEYGYPINYGYPVVEPEAVQVEPDVYSNPVQHEPKSPYREGRNLWQEIVYQFSKLLELMK